MAAKEFAKSQDADNIQLIPLKNSQNVANSLNAKKIDFGVVAFQNSLVGAVKETYVVIST